MGTGRNKSRRRKGLRQDLLKVSVLWGRVLLCGGWLVLRLLTEREEASEEELLGT